MSKRSGNRKARRNAAPEDRPKMRGPERDFVMVELDAAAVRRLGLDEAMRAACPLCQDQEHDH